MAYTLFEICVVLFSPLMTIDDIVAQHDKYIRSIENLTFDASTTSSNGNLDDVALTYSFFDKSMKIRSIRDKAKQSVLSKGKPYERVTCIFDNKYSFIVHRDNQESNYILDMHTSDLRNAQTVIGKDLWRNIRSPVMVRGTYLKEILGKDGYRLELTESTPDGRSVLNVSFSTTRPSDNEEDVSYSGKIYLNTMKLIEKYELFLTFRVNGKHFQRKQQFSVEYTSADNLLLPVRTMNSIIDVDGKPTGIRPYSEEWRLMNHRKGHGTINEYGLSYYGFNDAYSTANNFGIPYYFIFSIAGAILLVTSILLILRKRKGTS